IAPNSEDTSSISVIERSKPGRTGKITAMPAASITTVANMTTSGGLMGHWLRRLSTHYANIVVDSGGHLRRRYGFNSQSRRFVVCENCLRGDQQIGPPLPCNGNERIVG